MPISRLTSVSNVPDTKLAQGDLDLQQVDSALDRFQEVADNELEDARTHVEMAIDDAGGLDTSLGEKYYQVDANLVSVLQGYVDGIREVLRGLA